MHWLIFEVLGEDFTGDEQVVFTPNEHFINKQDGIEGERITDSSFTIIGVKTKRYLMECQSTPDNSMLVRIFEYATQIALDESDTVGDTLKVEIPNCAVLFLRSNRNTPDMMYLEITAPNGTLVIDVPVMKTQNYSLEELFEKNLLFLIPFYIFTYDKHLEEYNADEEKLEALKEEFSFIAKRLDDLVSENKLSYYYRKLIIEMSTKNVENLAAKYDNIMEGVKSVMGGRILETEATTIFREGEKRHFARRRKKLLDLIQKKLAKGQSPEQIADDLVEPLEYIWELIRRLKSMPQSNKT
ncbi:MAG: hypothetical protein LIO96_04095 [Lachnospiraceae bacterium]|nr:hypothetical protein [Lachnospiraceae bacterium]